MKRNNGTQRVAVLGGGAWGTTLGLVAHRAGNDVSLYVRNPQQAEAMRRERRHPRSLPGVPIPSGIDIGTEIAAALAGAGIVIVAIPTQKLRAGLEPVAGLLAERIVVSAAKGIEVGTLYRPSQIMTSLLPASSRVAVLSGPNLSGEIAHGKPATTVIAADDPAVAAQVQIALMGETFRVYTSEDVAGVEYGGALKNIVAIGAGIGDGLQAGVNARAAFLTRGIAEIARLGVAYGAQPLTFAGLSGVGDLIATCSSDLSRNHMVGKGLASGKSLDEVLAGMSEVAEGVATTRAALDLARAREIEMPIATELARVMFQGVSARDAIRSLMLREPRAEGADAL